VREACAVVAGDLWYDADADAHPCHQQDGIRALDLSPIVAAALKEEGE